MKIHYLSKHCSYKRDYCDTLSIITVKRSLFDSESLFNLQNGVQDISVGPKNRVTHGRYGPRSTLPTGTTGKYSLYFVTILLVFLPTDNRVKTNTL